MRSLLTIISVVSALGTMAQTGTLIVAAITEEKKIIIAADSRGSIYETDNHETVLPLAYCDSINKIYPLKQFVVAISGTVALGNDYYYKIIAEYNHTSFTSVSLDATLKDFISYLEQKYPLEKYPEKELNSFYAGGFVNGEPEIIAWQVSKNSYTHYISEGEIMSDEKAISYLGEVKDLPLKTYQKIEKLIYVFAEKEKQTVTIGGPISIVEIQNNNSVVYIQNDFSKKVYSSLQTFYEGVKNETVPMVYLVPNGKKKVLKAMRH